MSEKLEELISLLYQDRLTQCGKRLLVENIEKLQKENEELKILEDDIQDKRIVYIDTPEFEENYISKQKVKDKLEELNKEIKSCTEIDAIFKIKQQQILQELLESEE